MMAPSRSTSRNRHSIDVEGRTHKVTEDFGKSGRVRVAYVLTALCEGGLERFTLELGRRLPMDRFEPIVFCLTPLAPWADRFRDAGIPVFIYDARNKPGIASGWPNLRAIFELARDFRRHRIQIVHTCDFYPATMGRIAAFLARVPARVHTLHSLYDWYPGWAHRINRLLASRTHQVTAVSNPVLESSLKLDKLPTEKYRLVHNGVDATHFQPNPAMRAVLRDRLGIPASTRVITTVAAYTERKGHRTVAESILPLLKGDPSLHLALFGTVPEAKYDLRPELLEMFRVAGLSDQVHMPGPVEDVRMAYCGSDIFCMASQVEGLSLASIEAQMCGSLCLFSDIPSFREVVQEGVNGYLFPVDDVKALRQAIETALSLPPEQAEPIRINARRLAKEKFPIESTVKDYQDIYEEVLDSLGKPFPS
jgi:glycosyltransferase involved in cell wall biosynthesis